MKMNVVVNPFELYVLLDEAVEHEKTIPGWAKSCQEAIDLGLTGASIVHWEIQSHRSEHDIRRSIAIFSPEVCNLVFRSINVEDMYDNQGALYYSQKIPKENRQYEKLLIRCVDKLTSEYAHCVKDVPASAFNHQQAPMDLFMIAVNAIYAHGEKYPDHVKLYRMQDIWMHVAHTLSYEINQEFRDAVRLAHPERNSEEAKVLNKTDADPTDRSADKFLRH